MTRLQPCSAEYVVKPGTPTTNQPHKKIHQRIVGTERFVYSHAGLAMYSLCARRKTL